MYNEVYKNSFLDEIQPTSSESTYKQIVTFFNTTEEFENELQKDVACFTLNEIIGFYKNFSATSLVRLQNLNCQLAKYADWCNKNKIIPNNQNHFRQINLDILEQCINLRLRSAKCVTREELLRVIKSYIFDPAENFLLLALFEGICGNEYIEIRNLHLYNFKDNMVTLLSGEKWEVSDDLIELAYESSKCEYYLTSDEKKRKLENDSTKCFKFPENTVGDSNKEKFFIVRRLSKIKEDYMWAGSKELKESGRVDLIRKYMKQTGWDADTCIRKCPEVQERYGRIINVPRYCNAYEKELNEI